MEGGASTAGLGPLRIRTVRGEPYDVQGQRLVPIVRIVSLGTAKATIGTNQISGRGGGFVWIRPLAVLVETAEGERRVSITDGTAVAVRGLLGAAAGITLFFATVRWLVCLSRQARSIG